MGRVMSIVDQIEQIIENTDFDITSYVCPNDDTGFMLEDMKDYYRILYAVGCAVEPQKILVFNVAFGYGAMALLNAAPDASLEGVHSPFSSSCSVDWSNELISHFAYAKTVEPSSQVKYETYDLIELVGIGDGDYIFMTLERYACRSRWFVVSYDWLSINDTMALAFWIRKYNKLIRSTHMLPSRKGLWLIEMQSPSGQTLSSDSLKYKDIEQYYTGEYFLTDCGGYPQFRRSQGKELAEPRLMTICEIVSPVEGKRILDVGCGRGELAYALALKGAEVVAIDYAEGAVSLAQKTYQELDVCKSRQLVFEQRDLFAAEFDSQFDIVIAADFIEHIDSSLEQMAIRKLHAFLKPGGKLIIHTAPNLLNYRYTYKKRRQLAKLALSYLPPNPRSYYEQIVHINEQTPARLKRLLRRSFPHALIWVASDLDPCGTLLNKSRNGILTQGLSIFSVASDSELIKEEIVEKLSRLDSQMNWSNMADNIAHKVANAIGNECKNKISLRSLINIAGYVRNNLTNIIKKRNK